MPFFCPLTSGHQPAKIIMMIDSMIITTIILIIPKIGKYKLLTDPRDFVRLVLVVPGFFGNYSLRADNSSS